MLEGKATTAERIVEKTAKATDTDTLEQPPLYDAVDPEALDTLIERMSSGEVEFVYAGHDVTVESDGTITLEERPDERSTVDTVVGDR